MKIRIPWLIFGVAGGLVAVHLIGRFESALEEQIILAAFIPLITYMADAVGNQSQVVFIRALAVDEHISKLNYLIRELSVTFFLSIVLSLIVLVVVSIFTSNETIAIIVTFALFLTVNIASLIGIVLPLTFHILKQDPAVASGPFATIVRDLSSLLIYLGVASVLI
jgi:magnesium transporter